MNERLSVPTQNLSAGNQAKMAKERHQQGVFKEPRITFYIYLETIERGKENRPVKVVTQINKVSRQYQSEASDKRRKVYLNAIEQAAQIACEQVYQLKQQKQKFSRVFVSQFKGPERAKQDPRSFDYYA